jgi:hypothetical protein
MAEESLLELIRRHLEHHGTHLGRLRLTEEADGVVLVTCTHPRESGHGPRDLGRVRAMAEGFRVDWEGDPTLMPVADNTAGEPAEYPSREALLEALTRGVERVCADF